MLNKNDIKIFKELLFERISLLEESMMLRFNQMSLEINGLGKRLSSVEEVVININAYIEGELKVHLHQLEKKDRLLERRISKVQKKIGL
jgi:hypothetical protein